MQSAKFAICLGSFIAFSVTFFNGMMFGSNFIPVLRDSAIACLLAAIVMKFFVQIIVNNIRSSHAAHTEEVQARAADTSGMSDTNSEASASTVDTSNSAA
ncbi:MAG: hypothetical protein AAF212_04140 [Verrucomicrobiota bacterium]